MKCKGITIIGANLNAAGGNGNHAHHFTRI